MAVVTVNAEVVLTTQQLLNSVAQLDTLELEAFYKNVGRLLESRKSEQSASSLFSTVDSEEEGGLPIVEKLIPSSITLDGKILDGGTLDGDRLSF